MQRLAVLITCHNRRDNTLRCLSSLFNQVGLAGAIEVSVFLTDDGSGDGTATAVANSFPSVRVIHGDGTLYWNGGMRRAWEESMKTAFDYYLWLNDDTILFPQALSSMIDQYEALALDGHAQSVVVGSTRDKLTHYTTYGGVQRHKGWQLLKFTLIEPSPSQATRCDTFNGNCVLIPRAVVECVGTLDKAFTHGMGDFDYGLRAAASGVSLWIAPGHLGICPRNDAAGTWRDLTVSLCERLRRVREPKGLPPREWWVFTRRHAGPLWPIYWMRPYLHLVTEHLVNSRRQRQ